MSAKKMGMNIKRKLAHFLRYAEPLSDTVGLAAIGLFFLYQLPLEILLPNPATGGDMGSHFYPLVTLVRVSLPNFMLRVWNPGNLAGEPHLVHYFPFPFWVMAGLSTFLPLGMAFNVGTLLALFSLPFCVYFSLKLWRLRFPIPLFSAAASTWFLYNESYSMWGGNDLSTLAGQFAHNYALCFLFLGIGSLAAEIRRNQPPFWSFLHFTAVALSHAYIQVGVPFILLGLVFFGPGLNWRSRLWKCFVCGALSLLLSCWFLLPMIDNQKWTTPLPMLWNSGKLLQEIVPQIFYPALPILLIGFVLLLFRGSWLSRGSNFRKTLIFMFFPMAAYVGFYFVFTKIGLVDIRAVPQVQLFVCVASGMILGAMLQHLGRIVVFLLALPVTIVCLWWSSIFIVQFPRWAEWNYSGWETKPLYPDLKPLYDTLQGNFSQPRVVYENSPKFNAAGTPRVFEMLPYFTGRATLESVYTQASIVSPMIFYLQAEISTQPSCPFRQYKCTGYDLLKARQKLSLLGVGELILTSPEILAQAEKADFLHKEAEFGMFHLYAMNNQPSYAEVFQKRPRLIDTPDWRNRFYDWFREYDGSQPFLLLKERAPASIVASLAGGDHSQSNIWEGGDDCRPEVEVNFNTLTLRTPCPGRAHYLKFSFHSTWKTDTGDPTFLVSPGFIGLVPTKSTVILKFGHSLIWVVSDFISIVVFGLVVVWKVRTLLARWIKKRILNKVSSW